MLLQKTDKARAELQPGARTLSLRERSLLLMADGRKSVQDMRAVLGDTVEPMLRQLVDSGYLVAVQPAPPTSPCAAGGVRRRSGRRRLRGQTLVGHHPDVFV